LHYGDPGRGSRGGRPREVTNRWWRGRVVAAGSSRLSVLLFLALLFLAPLLYDLTGQL